MCLKGQPDFNRKRRLNKIVVEDIGPNEYFTVYQVLDCWADRWKRVPSVKEMSKVIAANTGLTPYREEPRGNLYYYWDGVKDLTLYITDTDDDVKRFREYRKKEKGLK